MNERGHRKTRQGLVTSSKMDKTVTVEVTRRFKHATFKKYVETRKRYYAHDAANACSVGDEVLIEETRPLSKIKHWRVKEVLKKAK